MIEFQTLEYKNFMSSGNMGIKIPLNSFDTTLVCGKNGCGKSTIIEALTFALYGKAFRNINKGQLVNSINAKGCEVILTFKNNGNNYKITRGIKPNIFEIECNGVVLDNQAALKDDQKYLEDNILKMNEKSFRQIIVLGSADYVPFMQLKAADRREIVEDLLDIKVFSEMNKLLKEKISELKTEVMDSEYKHNMSINQYDMFCEYEKKASQQKSDDIKRIDEDISSEKNNLKPILDKISDLTTKLNSIDFSQDEYDKCNNKILELTKALAQISVKEKAQDDKKIFFETNDNCFHCKQGIPHEHKEGMIKEAESELRNILDMKKKFENSLLVQEKRRKNIQKMINEMNDIKSDISSQKNIAYGIEQVIEKLEKNKSIMLKEQAKPDISKKTALLDELNTAKENLNKIKKDFDNHVFTQKILKDDGIKTRIVKKYLPVINKTVNKYLATLGMSVNFSLNENFEEIIKSRHRDEFSYSSFSEGEKARIDLSIMLTWREIAKLKNSSVSNLLIMDEVFDGSLDSNATEDLMSILNTMSTTNIFIMSHRNDSMYDKFKNYIEFDKKNGFSHATLVSDE